MKVVLRSYIIYRKSGGKERKLVRAFEIGVNRVYRWIYPVVRAIAFAVFSHIYLSYTTRTLKTISKMMSFVQNVVEDLKLLPVSPMNWIVSFQ